MKKLIRSHKDSFLYGLTYLLTIFPPLLLLMMIFRFNINFPFYDQWDFIPTLVSLKTGTLTFAQLWAQHNEHRIFFPRTIMVILAAMSGWDIRWQIGMNFLLGVGIFLALSYLFYNRVIKQGGIDIPLLFPILSFFIFSLNQWENWFWGWQIQILLNVLAVIIGIIFLTSNRLSWRSFLLSLVYGFIATFSFATGIVYWPMGFILLCLQIFLSKKKQWHFIALWIGATFFVYFLYMWGYKVPPNPPSRWVIAHQPFEFATYILVFLGSPILAFNVAGALFVGIVGIVLFIITVKLLHAQLAKYRTLLLPCFGLSLYTIFCAFMTGVGRAAFGPEQAASSRYQTFSQLFWIALTVCLLVSLKKAWEGRKEKRIATLDFLFLTLFLLVTTASASMLLSMQVISQRYHVLLLVRNEMLANGSREDKTRLYAQIYSFPDLIPEKLSILKTYNLSFYRQQ